MTRPWIRAARTPAIPAFAISLVILVPFALSLGSRWEVGGDTPQYLALAGSLAAGDGFQNTAGPWPDRPAYDRMPGWPAILSLGLLLAPGVPPLVVTRLSGVVCLALAGSLLSAITSRLGVRRKLSVAAGLALSLSPPLVVLAIQGLSEPAFVVFALAALLGLLCSGRWLYVGALCAAVGPLIRTNFILIPLACLGLAVLFPAGRQILFTRSGWRRAVWGLLLAYSLPCLWMIRNYRLTGRAPFLSSIHGETLYGGNNSLVASNLDVWGVWVMPDAVPGEVPKLKLATILGSDLKLNDYYHDRGMEWLRNNGSELPRLILGKLIRGFVPLPWRPLVPSYVAFGYRFLLDVLYVGSLPFWWRSVDRTYLLFALAMFLVTVLTTCVYYGVYRFTYCFVEVLFIPCIASGLEQWLRSRAPRHVGGETPGGLSPA